MNSFFLIILFSLTMSPLLLCQDKIGVGAGYGNYLLNSENDLQLLQENTFSGYFVWGLHYEYRYNQEYSFSFDYDYKSTEIDNVYEIVHTNSQGDILGVKGLNYSLINHNFDLLLKYQNDDQLLVYGIGPAFVITNRTLYLTNTFNDMLASSGIGLCGTLDIPEPLKLDTEPFTYTIQAKLRYTHSIWFDEGIRNLDGYSQNFLNLQICFIWQYNIYK